MSLVEEFFTLLAVALHLVVFLAVGFRVVEFMAVGFHVVEFMDVGFHVFGFMDVGCWMRIIQGSLFVVPKIYRNTPIFG